MITSVQNKLVREWKKLHRKKYRYEKNQFLIEGYHLIEEAYRSNQNIDTVIAVKGVNLPEKFKNLSIIFVNETVFKEISQTETPQGIAAIVDMMPVVEEHDHSVLLIDAIQDPGNLGTIIRTADAAGFSKIILGSGTVDMYNDKVIRASQGSIFHIPIYQANLEETIPKLKEMHYKIWASTLENARNYRHFEVPEKTAIIFGNEGRGIDETYIEMADERVVIPIFGQAESLNVSVAAGILMYYIRNETSYKRKTR